MNKQQLDFLMMSEEFFEDEKCTKGESTLQMFLKYCPDALTHLFDLCIVKPCSEQVS
jgi:hypothetical protein